MKNNNGYSKEFLDWLEKYIFSIEDNLTLQSLVEIRVNCSEELDIYIKSLIKRYG